MEVSSASVCVDPSVCTPGYSAVHAMMSDCSDAMTVCKIQDKHPASFDTMSTTYSARDTMSIPSSTSIEQADEDQSFHSTECITASDEPDTPRDDDSDALDSDYDVSYHRNLDFPHDACDDGQGVFYDDYCETATLTPTSDDDTLYFDYPDECPYETKPTISKPATHPLVSSECIVGLLSRYIDSTPTLQSTSMRLLITKSAIVSTDVIPSQVIRYNISSAVNYENLRAYLDMSPVFNCVRLPSVSTIESPSTVASEPPTDDEADLHKLLIVLDLDETLVHMHDRPHDHFDYLVNIVEHEDSEAMYAPGVPSNPDVMGFIVHPTMQVSLRPGVVEFFKYLRAHSSRFRVGLYTAGTRHYANAIMHALDPNYEVISRTARFYRDSCVVTPTPQTLRGLPADRLGLGNHHRDECVPPFYLKKDLEVFGWPLERVVFFDNSLLSFMKNPDNGVWIKPWRGVQPFIDKEMATVDFGANVGTPRGTNLPGQDDLYEFAQIVRLLEDISGERDVRDALRRKFTLSELVRTTSTCMEDVSKIDGSNTD